VIRVRADSPIQNREASLFTMGLTYPARNPCACCRSPREFQRANCTPIRWRFQREGFQTTRKPFSWMCNSRALCANAYLRRLEEHRRGGRIKQVGLRNHGSSRSCNWARQGIEASTRQSVSFAEPATRPLILCSSSCSRSSSSRVCWASLVSASRILALSSNPA
jgi:hypothetical protein